MKCSKMLCGVLLTAFMFWSCGGDGPASSLPSPVTVETEKQTQDQQEEEEIQRHVQVLPPGYWGHATLEERISVADVIARVRMLSVEASSVRFDTLANRDGGTTPASSQPYSPVLKFTFDVVEYLKSGDSPPTRINAMVGSFQTFDTASDAEDEANGMLTRRNARWDSHEAIIFLTNESTSYPATASDDLYFMSLLDGVDPERLGDVYSIASRRNRIWLPATSPANAQVAGELRFYLEEPEASESQPSASGRSAQGAAQTQSTTMSIGMSELKTKVTEVDDMIVDGSRKHELCVIAKFYLMRFWAHRRSEGHVPKVEVEKSLAKSATIQSGQPAGTEVLDFLMDNKISDDWQGRSWLEGEGADLFNKGEVTQIWNKTASVGNSFFAKGGKLSIEVQNIKRLLETVRPIPKGAYNLRWKSQAALFVPCNYEEAIYDYSMRIKVVGSQGTLHEAFFDPVTDGSAVAADSSNGILKPASFTDANSASASLQRIEWASDTVKVKVSPHTGLAGQTVDFIELDGSVSLSLNIDDATVDAANNTLSWTVAEQPWYGGDKLMLRIHKALPAPDDVSVSLSGGTYTVSWSAVTGATDYRAQYRTGGSEAEWTDLDVTTGTSRTFSPEGGVACSTTYEFRVHGRGDGTTYSAAWGKLSESASHTNSAGKCNRPPVFTSSSYTFTVSENAPAWPAVHIVGLVSASDPDDGDSLTYWITAGNGAGRFMIDNSRGDILVWAALDYETTSSYTLTVEARDGKQGGTSSTTVEITVTDVAE